MNEVVAVYADGGMMERNPSPIGGTWAWCHVDADGKRVKSASGVFWAVFEGDVVTNNQTEFIAAVRGLEALPWGWSGQLCLDSEVTLNRLCKGWALTNIPADWVARARAVLSRLGEIVPVLLQGHPTPYELMNRVGNRNGKPVSEHNVYVDMLCQEKAREWLEVLSMKKGEVGSL